MRTSQKTPETITTIGIDLGKNTFHLVGLDDHPGRNITGMSSIVTDLEAKRLEILKEIVPGIKRVGILGDFRNSAVVMQWDEVQTAARSLALEVEPFDVRNSEDSGLVASFPHPGGNVTGFMVMEPTMAGKWLELLKEIAPRVARVALLFNPATATYAEYYLKPFKAASASLAVEAIALPVRDTSELESIIATHAREPNGGLIVMPDTSNDAYRAEITSLAARYRLPAVCPLRFYAEVGCLLSYGPLPTDNFRRAAQYADRILKGEKPSDLPVQAPVNFVLTINLKAAKALGLDVPALLQQRADEVIE